MRIAFSGAHATGKTTLIDELLGLLPHFEFVGEPYHALFEEGYLFADVPAAEDFEAQLERSIEILAESDGADVLFDRCPVDFLAYLECVRDGGDAVSRWLDEATEALTACDLVVFVPIETPDRIACSELPALRQNVDLSLRAILLEDAWGLGVEVLEASGSLTERVDKVLARLDAREARDARDAR